VANLAGGHIDRLGSDADEEISGDLRAGNAREPKIEQFGVGQPAGRTKQGIV
jgi:hypothetical protein